LILCPRKTRPDGAHTSGRAVRFPLLGGEPCHSGSTGAPILDNAPAFVECKLVGTIEKGDHSLFVGEVVNAGVTKQPEGRADDATLWLKDLGEKVFYGG
jgi:flavin reductase (DIM6/NTAB) family NADH-FMN oxidoreductase RutF